MTTLIVAIVLIALAAVFLAYKAGQTRGTQRSESSTIAAAPVKLAPVDADPISVQPMHEVFHNVELVDSEGAVVMDVEQMPGIPFTARRLDSSSDEVNRLGQLASDFLEAGVSIPGKTIRLVFKPEIAQGLKDGTYTLMRTTSGEVLADAVNKTGQVAGKGRVVQAGSARQLAVGAFQLVSIAVAQAHLADIERSLGKIKSGISELIDRLETTDRTSISGTIAYLSEIAQHMKGLRRPIEISSEKSHQIESINHMGFEWRDKVQGDLADLTRRIRGLTDKDTFGTGNTHKELLDLVQKIQPLLVRYGLLLQLVAVTNMIVTYLDPAGRKYTRMRPQVEEWIKLVDIFRSEAVEKADALLRKSRFTSDELLDYRRTEIHRLVNEWVVEAKLQTSNFVGLMQELDQSTRQLTHGDGEVSLALMYDNDGVVRDAAFVQ
ncbi:hypothetical protein IAG25_12750 [Caballeronia sp. EK]|uniref:hypothetical protein n=1 Tax=Caballeronia sp. EK TaxID=2767469 RepID=UPI001654E2D2|nr:hypothetical protein [Caballeronia sp. EK]MBC8637682.1 hypothetical protein [Caballeronia sp. EK]